MRNLKKFLALALAMIMALSVMSIASAKTYSDSDSVTEKYAEAVQVLTGLEVFQGYSDSTFQPQGNITRAEVAAIIYRVVTGDVSDGNVGLYADYDKFDDVTSTDWFAGYVNYCANAEYVKGVGGNKFNPKGNVTGYEVLAMILRAVGYDQNDEFTGADWKVKVASTARELNITDTVSEVTLGKAVTREVVAELLFRTIAKVPTVTYTSALGYNQYTSINGTTKNPTLGEKTFSLVSIDGVVTANEYADLYSGSALAAGKTEIDGTVYAVSTELTDIGESRVGWAYGKDKTVIYIADSGKNTVFETGAETNLANFKQVTGLTDSALYLINFDSSYDWAYRANILITYSTTGAIADAVRITSGSQLSWTDFGNIRSIFNATYENGWVIVGTKASTANNADNLKNDISNDIGFWEFVNTYLTYIDNANTFTTSVNGDWLKVIDNDGDGVAEYVFKTEAVMAKVVSLTSKGVLTLKDDVTNHDDTLTVVYGGTRNTPFTTEDELAAGDVVLYTVIDGTCYVQLAESFTGKVDKYTYKTNVLTVDGKDYEGSGIEEHTGLLSDLNSAAKNTSYTYYKDWFGYIRAFAVPAADANSLVLLTDAYFQTGRTQNTYAVAAYLDGAVGDYDVADNNAGFINGAGDNNSWGKLNPYADDDTEGGANDNTDLTGAALTNVARYSKDGTTLTLSAVKTYTVNGRGQTTGIATDYVDLNETDLTAGQRTYTGAYVIDADDAAAGYSVDGATAAQVAADATAANVRVQANNNTVFYYVSYLRGSAVVTSVTGYANTLAVSDAVYGINAVYAVASNTNADSSSDPYWVADVIVIETDEPVAATTNSVVFGYNVLNKTVKDFGYLESILSDASLGELDVVSVNGVAAGNTINYNGTSYTTIPTVAFYVNAQLKDSTDSYITTIQSGFAARGIYVAKADRVNLLNDYVVALDARHTELGITDSTVVYDITDTSRGVKIAKEVTTKDADGNTLKIETGETYVIYTNAKNEVIYAIHVDTDATGAVTDTVMSGLYNLIYNDANPAAPVDALTAARNEAKQTLRDFIAVIGGNVNDTQTSAIVADLDALIDFRTTVDSVNAVFNDDGNALGETYNGDTYTSTADEWVNTTYGALKNYVTASGTASGNLKTDVMNAVTYDTNALATAKTTGKAAIVTAAAAANNAAGKTVVTAADVAAAQNAIDATTTAADETTVEAAQVNAIYDKAITSIVSSLKTNGVTLANGTTVSTTTIASAVTGTNTDFTATASNLLDLGTEATCDIEISFTAGGTAQTAEGVRVTVAAAP
jgi:hypothetical protein